MSDPPSPSITTSVPSVSWRVLLALAWPIVLARSTQAVMGFWDTVMVAPLGDDALAASGTGAMNAFTVMILPMGTVFIVQSFVAQLVGRGEAHATRRFAWYGLGLAAVTGVVAVAALPFVPLLIRPFAYGDDVRTLMEGYLVMRLPSMGAVVATEALGNWFGGHGNTRLQMHASVVAMVVDMFLNWTLIYGELGFPRMGVEGAALASTIGSFAGLAVLLVAFARGWGGVPRTAGPIGWRWREVRRVLRFGLPNGFNWFLEFVAFVLFINVMVAHLGTAALAALNVVININAVAFMPAFGITSAGAILVGQTVGAGAKERVWPIVRLTATVTLIWMASVGLSYLVAPETIIGFFAREGAEGLTPAELDELRRVGVTMLVMSTAWQAFDAIAMTLSEALRAAGDTAWTLGARLVLAWLVFTPAAWFFVVHLPGGAVAAMLCLTGYLGLLAAAFAWRFRSGAWKKIDLVGHEPTLD